MAKRLYLSAKVTRNPFAMPPEPVLPTALLRLIDGLCDVFERGW